MASDMNEVEKKAISRRQFMKGAAASATIIAGSTLLPGCSPTTSTTVPESETESGVNGSSTGKYSWETPPEAIPAADIKETIEADVVVIGAGVSGLATAVRAKENGANVVVIEKGTTWSGRGGHFGVTDSSLMREQGISIDKRTLVRQWIAQCGNRVKEDIVWLFVNESGSAMDWFIEKADAAGLPKGIYDGIYRGESYTEYAGTHMFGMGENVAKTLYENAVELGITFVFEAPGVQLVKENDRVIGVIANTADGYKQYNGSKGVVLATGDIGGDQEMLEAFAPLALKMNGSQYTPIGLNTGDGHKMGYWAGGVFEETPFPSVLHPQGYAWLSYYILFVNQQGNRYMNEDTWLQPKSLNAMRQPGNGEPYCYTVFDSNWPTYIKESLNYGGGLFWDSMGRMVGEEWTPDTDQETIAGYVEDGNLGFQADTLEELAEKMGVPAETFKATVERYNQMCANQEDTDYGKRPELLNPVDTPPYYALKFGGSLLVITGGLNVDTKLKVLDKDQNPIPGLYAVGNVAGNLYGVDYPTIIPGNSHGRALTWGYLVGNNIMEA